MGKLTKDQEKEIIQSSKTTKTTNKKLGEKYGVSAQYIGKLKKKYEYSDKFSIESDTTEGSLKDSVEKESKSASPMKETTEETKQQHSESETNNFETDEDPEEVVFDGGIDSEDIKPKKQKEQVKQNNKNELVDMDLEELDNIFMPKQDPKQEVKPVKKGPKPRAPPKSEFKLNKKDFEKLGIDTSKKTKAKKATTTKPRSEIKKEKDLEVASEDDTKQKLIFKLHQIVKKYPDNIIVTSVFDDLEPKHVLQVLQKKNVEQLKVLEKNLKSNIMLSAQCASTSGNYVESFVLVGSNMIELLLGRFIDIHGFTKNIQDQLENNESLKASIDMYKLDSIDFLTLSPSTVIAMCLGMSLMSTFRENKYSRKPTQPINKNIKQDSEETKNTVVEEPVKEETPKVELPININENLQKVNERYNDL